MSNNLSWMRVQGEYRSNAYDSSMAPVGRVYMICKDNPSHGGGWLLHIDGEWYGAGGTLAEAKAQAERHHHRITKYGEDPDRSVSAVVQSIDPEKLAGTIERQINPAPAGKKIYVATVFTRYEVMGAGSTAKAARKAAAEKAIEFLRANGCSAPEEEWNTVAKMDEYLGITVTEVLLDGAGSYVGGDAEL
jgi:hypothetical protein